LITDRNRNLKVIAFWKNQSGIYNLTNLTGLVENSSISEALSYPIYRFGFVGIIELTFILHNRSEIVQLEYTGVTGLELP
jgi:hypothetical protein